jgi:hypothetical protein
MIFNDTYRMIRGMITYWAIKIDKKYRHVKFPHSNTAGTLVV